MLKQNLRLALLLLIITKSVQTLLMVVYQSVKSFTEKKNVPWPGNHWNGSTDLCGAFPPSGIEEVRQCNWD